MQAIERACLESIVGDCLQNARVVGVHVPAVEEHGVGAALRELFQISRVVRLELRSIDVPQTVPALQLTQWRGSVLDALYCDLC